MWSFHPFATHEFQCQKKFMLECGHNLLRHFCLHSILEALSIDYLRHQLQDLVLEVHLMGKLEVMQDPQLPFQKADHTCSHGRDIDLCHCRSFHLQVRISKHTTD